MSDSYLSVFFSRLSDEELIKRTAAGSLTDEAQAIASAELNERGLNAISVSPQTAEPEPSYIGDWVILEKGLSPTDAHLYASYLESAGIPADVGDANFVQAHHWLSFAAGGAKLKVPGSKLLEAKEVMEAFRRGDFNLGDDFDPSTH